MKPIISSKVFITRILPFAVFIVMLFAVAVVFQQQSHNLSYTKMLADRQAATTSSAAATPTATPTPRTAYVPYLSDIQPLPDIATLASTENYLRIQGSGTFLKISWDTVANADYYLLCIFGADQTIVEQEIFKSDVTSWEIANYQGAKVLLFCYQDMGQDGTADDKLLVTYSFEPIAVVTVTASPTPTPKPTKHTSTTVATPVPTPVPPPQMNKYFIIVDKADFAFAVFTYDENNQYTKLVATFPCALGRSGRMTPTGTFEIGSKGVWKTWEGYSVPEYSPYYTAYTSGLYFHGPIYTAKSGDSLIASSYDQIGTASSAGCVRTTTRGAKFVYFNCPAGTKVQVVASSDLVSYPGKPAIDPNYPTWDPTDPNKPEAMAGPAVTLSCLPEQGTVDGGGTFEDGTLIAIHAVPLDGFTFVHWIDAANAEISTQSTYSFYVTNSVSYTAVFAPVITPAPVTDTLPLSPSPDVSQPA